MDIKNAYDIWSEFYDSNENKTRDLEAYSLRNILSDLKVESCLELGCGTGKNTEWLALHCNQILAVDFSDKMLEKAKTKILAPNVHFVQADLNTDWNFIENKHFDLAVCSLVLEHIQNLNPIFENLSHAIKPNGYVYLSELHPYKQYSGAKAKFETESGTQILTSYTHHISDFFSSALKNGFILQSLNEFFDNNATESVPRILTLLFTRVG